MLFSLLSAPYPPVQFAQTNVAMRDERAHTKFFGEGKSLEIVVFRLPDIEGDLRAPRSRRGAEECTPRVLSLCADGRDPGRAVPKAPASASHQASVGLARPEDHKQTGPPG